MSKSLQVCVHRQSVGTLVQEKDECIFSYATGVAGEYAVSLTMPVRSKSYSLPELHPVFEMHLPEGYLLAVIKKHFAKVTATDDFGLLRLMAPGIRGRLHYAVPGPVNEPSLHLEDLLHPATDTLFDELVERFAMRSALSGVQPKVLARVENKATLKLEDYIVKAWGPDYPELAMNEYYCMLACQYARIPVPEFYLSDDEALFIMKRFDLRENGLALGFEDMCVLQGKQRDDKYTGSYEQVARSIKQFTSPAFKASSLAQFFKMVVLNNHLQNGDAHLKNFAVLYEDHGSVRLAPAYDVVSTTAYIRKDIAALTLMGSKKWWGEKHLIRFGMNACDLSQKQATALYQECTQALGQVHELITKRLEKESQGEKIKVLKHLLQLSDAAASAK